MRNRANWVIALSLGGAGLLLLAAMALFGPVKVATGDCGSVALPGNSDSLPVADDCDEARADRTTLVLATGPAGVVLVGGALVLRSVGRRRGSVSAP
jgi:hypothetical protein